MIILSIHSSTPRLAAAVARDGGILAERELPPGREHLENLPGLVTGLLSEIGMDLGSVDGFAVAAGPGSFSGIRVGMAAAKGMALALSKPVIGVSSLAALARSTLEEGETGLAVIDARRKELYAAAYTRSGAALSLTAGPLLVPADSVEQTAREVGPGAVICCDPSLGGMLDMSVRSTVKLPVISQAAACALVAMERYKEGATNEIHQLAPIYVRLSDAEEKKRRRSE